MPSFRLRDCQPGDEAMLSLVGGASFLEAFADTLDVADILAHCEKNHSQAAYQRYLAAPENRTWVAEMTPGNAPAGYAVCTLPDLPLPDLTPADYELRRIYLLYRFQGTGIGRALMQQAIASATQQGFRRLLLGVYGKNFDAIRFYEKAGFTTVGERLFTVGSTTHHDLVMARSL